MADTSHTKDARVLGPSGRPITLDDLPSPKTRRWSMNRKAAIVAGVRAGLLSLEEACRLYYLSIEEFLSWQILVDQHGVRGLRATQLQQYRKTRS